MMKGPGPRKLPWTEMVVTGLETLQGTERGVSEKVSILGLIGAKFFTVGEGIYKYGRGKD